MTHNQYKRQLGKKLREMTEEELRTYYKLRYHSHTPTQRKQHRARGREWYHNNHAKVRASVHTSTIKKKYPDAMEGSDVSTPILLNVWIQQADPVCKFCGQEGTSIDHIQPLSRGGKHHSSNLQLLCHNCNMMKSSLTDMEFMNHIFKIVEFSTTN